MSDRKEMRVGMYGGTFDPPHYGHVVAAAEAARKLEFDKLYVVPAFIPPHKRDERCSPASDRLEMAELAFRKIPGVVVSDIEIKREGMSYTADTLEELGETHPDAKLYLLLGADKFLTVQNWVRSEEIFAACTPVAFARDEGQTAELQRHAGFLMERYSAHCEVLETHILPASSSEIREKLAAGEECELIQDEVREYIERRRLYRGEK